MRVTLAERVDTIQLLAAIAEKMELLLRVLSPPSSNSAHNTSARLQLDRFYAPSERLCNNPFRRQNDPCRKTAQQTALERRQMRYRSASKLAPGMSAVSA